MKKLILSLIAAASFLAIPVISVSTAAAMGTPSETIVTGVVTNNSNPVVGASVTVTCDGNVLTDTTDATGTYQVTYSPNTMCAKNTDAVVTATKGKLEGSNSGPVNAVTNKINLDVVNVSAVPELGFVTGTGAAVIGGGVLIAVRRRSLRGNER